MTALRRVRSAGMRCPLLAESGPRRGLSRDPHTVRVKTIDEMLSLDLLSAQEHREIAWWLQVSSTPEAIMAMPPELWRALESASVAMNIDADLVRPPLLGADSA
jgi:hypothetical protein